MTKIERFGAFFMGCLLLSFGVGVAAVAWLGIVKSPLIIALVAGLAGVGISGSCLLFGGASILEALDGVKRT